MPEESSRQGRVRIFKKVDDGPRFNDIISTAFGARDAEGDVRDIFREHRYRDVDPRALAVGSDQFELRPVYVIAVDPGLDGGAALFGERAEHALKYLIHM